MVNLISVRFSEMLIRDFSITGSIGSGSFEFDFRAKKTIREITKTVKKIHIMIVKRLIVLNSLIVNPFQV